MNYQTTLSSGLRAGLGAAVLLVAAGPIQAALINPATPIPTQLLSFGPNGISGDVFLPLTNAAGNSGEAGAPTPVDGYGWVKSHIRIDLSTTNPSMGQAFFSLPLFPVPNPDRCLRTGIPPIPGNVVVNQGDSVCVDSVFGVFFDVTIADIDNTVNYFAGLPATLMASGGPVSMQYLGECTADVYAPNLGCLPPVGFPYIGHFQITAPLGVDINGSGFNDFLKFTFGAHNVGGVTNTIVNNNIVTDTFGSNIPGTGAVSDVIGDPPFTFDLNGPTTARQDIVYPAPEPASLLLFGAGLGLLGMARRRFRG